MGTSGRRMGELYQLDSNTWPLTVTVAGKMMLMIGVLALSWDLTRRMRANPNAVVLVKRHRR